MIAQDIMTTDLVTVTEDTPITEAATVLEQHALTGMPVVQGTKVVGIITEGDFILKNTHLHLPSLVRILGSLNFDRRAKKLINTAYQTLSRGIVKDIMTRNVVTVKPSMDVTKVVELFRSKNVNPVPIVDDTNNLIGIISKADLVKLVSGLLK